MGHKYIVSFFKQAKYFPKVVQLLYIRWTIFSCGLIQMLFADVFLIVLSILSVEVYGAEE